MSRPAGVPAAATTALHPLLSGPPRAAVVRGLFPSAVYLDTGEDVLAVVSTDGLRLPCALVVAAHSHSRPFAGLASDDTATVGDGAVVVGGKAFVVRRWGRSRRARAVHPGAALAARVDALRDLLPEPPGELPPDPGTWTPGVLVGRGPGLTPAGDDVLAAMLVTLAAAPGAAAAFDGLAAETAELLARTNSLSASLLRHAAAGRAIPQVLDVVDAVTGTGALASATTRLLHVGHSSGLALAHGIVAASQLVADADATQAA